GSTFSGTTTINDGQWHHIACARTSSGQQGSLYVDGKVVATSTSATGSGIDTDNILRVGRNSAGTSLFNGQIDNIRIYKYARSAPQIAWDYNRGKPIAHWKFDECQGTTIHDSSGNGNTGTLTVGGSGSQTSAGTCNTSSTAWGNG